MVHPSVAAILVTPVCPHSLSFRPIILPAGVELKVMPVHFNPSFLTFKIEVNFRSTSSTCIIKFFFYSEILVLQRALSRWKTMEARVGWSHAKPSTWRVSDCPQSGLSPSTNPAQVDLPGITLHWHRSSDTQASPGTVPSMACHLRPIWLWWTFQG